MREDRVSIAVADHVATVTMVRADKHNALDKAMFESLVAAADHVGGERGVRAVVLCGEGPSFCSGLDVSVLGTNEGISPDELARRGRTGTSATSPSGPRSAGRRCPCR